MHKDELIQLHALLVQLRSWFERNGNAVGTPFKEYEACGVKPQHIHKSKVQHKRAVFLLGKELALAVGGAEEFTGAHRVGHRLSELAKKVNGGFKTVDPLPSSVQT